MSSLRFASGNAEVFDLIDSKGVSSANETKPC